MAPFEGRGTGRSNGRAHEGHGECLAILCRRGETLLAYRVESKKFETVAHRGPRNVPVFGLGSAWNRAADPNSEPG